MSITTFVGSETSRELPTGAGRRWIVYCWLIGSPSREAMPATTSFSHSASSSAIHGAVGRLLIVVVVDAVVALVDPAVIVVVEPVDQEQELGIDRGMPDLKILERRLGAGAPTFTNSSELPMNMPLIAPGAERPSARRPCTTDPSR